MSLNLNDIKYGNPDRDQVPYLQLSSFLEKDFNEFARLTCPANDSETVARELNDLQGYMQKLLKDGEARIRMFQHYDLNLWAVLHNFLVTHHIPEQDSNALLEKYAKDILPLVYKLKYYFQRPRPVQLAYYHKLMLYPIRNFSANCPSYPSLHTIVPYVFAGIVQDMYPGLAHEALNLAQDISGSRQYLGVSYNSDIEVGIYIAEKILENKELKLKYGL